MEKTTSNNTSFSPSNSSIEQEHENSSALSSTSESDASLSSALSSTPEYENKASLLSDSPITPESKEYISFVSDRPIASSKHDTLERAKIAQRLANTIAIRKDSPCLTIGLYGAWGSGKTSILKMIKEELEKRTEKNIDLEELKERTKKNIDLSELIEKIESGSPIRGVLTLCEKNEHASSISVNEHASSISVMDFNPWFFRSEEALLQKFLSELSHTIEAQFTGTTKENLRNLLKDYSNILTLASAALPSPFNQLIDIAIKKVDEKLSSTSITEIKEKIEKELDKNKKKIVVFIDDIDRLDKEEIHALFKIIRLCADFPYVTYVLAFDYDVVTASLQERYCADQEKNAGAAFLEKIIQVPLHVPMPAERMFLEIIDKRLKDVLLQTGTELKPDQKYRFDTCFELGILPKITTLRLINLYCNALLFSLSLLQEEVCPADLMIIEGIRLFYPKLYDDIRKNFYAHLENGNVFPKKEKIEAFFENNLSEDSLKKDSNIRKLLLELFPTIRMRPQDKAWDKEYRICSPLYFHKYFMYAVPLDDISDNEIDDFLALFENYEESKRDEQTYTEMNKFFSLPIVRRKCVLKLDVLTEKQATAFLDFLLCNLSPIEKDLEASPRELFRYSPHELLTNSLKRADEESKNKFFLKLVQDSEPFHLVILLFWEQRWIWEKQEDNSVNPHYKDTLSSLARRIQKIDEKSPLYTQKEINTCSAYCILLKELGYEAFNDYLKSRFDASPDDVDLFLENLLGWKDAYTTQWKKDGYSYTITFSQYLKDFIDPQYIADNLTHCFGEKLTQEYVPTNEEYFQVNRAKQFMTWYNNFQNNKGKE